MGPRFGIVCIRPAEELLGSKVRRCSMGESTLDELEQDFAASLRGIEGSLERSLNRVACLLHGQ